MSGMARIVKKRESKVIDTIDEQKHVTQIIIGEDSQVFRLKNIMPTGFFSFVPDDGGKNVIIGGEREFEMTYSEITNVIDSAAFLEGAVVFMENYEDFKQLTNCLSNEEIKNLIDSEKNDFEVSINSISSQFAFNRIKNKLISMGASSDRLQYVQLREQELHKIKKEKTDYITDEERMNQESVIQSNF